VGNDVFKLFLVYKLIVIDCSHFNFESLFSIRIYCLYSTSQFFYITESSPLRTNAHICLRAQHGALNGSLPSCIFQSHHVGTNLFVVTCHFLLKKFLEYSETVWRAKIHRRHSHNNANCVRTTRVSFRVFTTPISLQKMYCLYALWSQFISFIYIVWGLAFVSNLLFDWEQSVWYNKDVYYSIIFSSVLLYLFKNQEHHYMKIKRNRPPML